MPATLVGNVVETPLVRHNVDMDTVPGTQAISRAAAVLRVVSAAAPNPVASARIATELGITRPTAHRVAGVLAVEGFLDRDPLRGGWLLGPELYLMGAVAAVRYDVTVVAAEHVRSLARESGESAFLSARRGDETVCLLREEGSFPLRSFVLHEGIRFPLGVASAGLAILAMLPDDEREAYLARVSLQTWGDDHAEPALRERLAQTRESGVAVNPGLLVEGSWGMGAAVLDATGRPAWALSLTGVESRFRPDRRRELGRLLLEHAHALGRELGRR